MPAYSGTVSASQGVRTIDVTPNDVVTFTPSSATYTVEYPIGTVAISASTATQTLPANTSATQMRILCVSGSVAYANVDNNDGTPLTPTESTTVRALVSRAGNPGNRFIDFGDSRAAQAYNTIELPSTPPGNSHRAQGASVWANAIAGQRMVWAGNYGVGGNTAADCVARLSALDAVQFDWMIFQCDLNDVAADRAYASIVADYETVYAYALRRGAQVIQVAPYAPSVALSAARSQVLLKLRDYILRVPARLQHVSVVDAFALFSTASASPPTSPAALVLDSGTTGYHYNVAGAALIGRAIAAIWTAQVPDSAPLLASAADAYSVDSTNSNINEFGLMLANAGTLGTAVSAPAAWVTTTPYTAGVVVTSNGNAYQATTGAATPAGATAPSHTSGIASDGAVSWRFLSSVASTGVASGYTLKRQGTASGTIYAWLAARTDGVGQDQCFVMSGAGSATTVQFNQTTDNSARFPGGAAAVAGQAAPITEMEVAIANASGCQAVMARTLMTLTGSFAGTYQWRAINASTEVVGNIPFDTTVRLKTPAGTLPASGTVTAFESQCFISFAAASAGGFFRVGRHSCRLQ